MSIFTLVLGVTLSFGSHTGASASSSPAVVFVCEHGAAKSLIATAYFNKLAAERGLAARATFRGVAPQDELSVRAVAGLKADGMAMRMMLLRNVMGASTYHYHTEQTVKTLRSTLISMLSAGTPGRSIWTHTSPSRR